MKPYYKISEISALYNICPDSLRYYEEKGILSPRRDDNGYRQYSLKDIWKLNVIKDLRELDFSMNQIKAYLDDRTVAATSALLNQEERVIEEKIAKLEQMKKNIQKRQDNISQAMQQPIGQMMVKDYPPRYGCLIRQNVSLDGEIDFLIKRLEKQQEHHLYIVGNNHIGAFLDDAYWRKGIYNQYSGVFILMETPDENDYMVIAQGEYLSLLYQGGYEQSSRYIPQMLDYIERQGWTMQGEPLELYRIDIHETSQKEEFLTEIQIAFQR